MIAFDYGWGHEVTGGFQRVFEDLGGQVIQKIWTPVTAMDETMLAALGDTALDVRSFMNWSAALNTPENQRFVQFFKALRATEIKSSPRGPIKINKYGHIVQNVCIRRVDKVGSLYQNTVIETSPSVSQFWKYNPEEYLKQPLFTRDNPPCKHC